MDHQYYSLHDLAWSCLEYIIYSSPNLYDTFIFIRRHSQRITTQIDATNNGVAQLFDTTVGYLLGEVAEADTFKDPAMLKRIQDINTLADNDKHCIHYTIDGLLRDAKTRVAYK